MASSEELSPCRPAHLAEAAGVPELVAEVLAALDPLLLEADVLALGRDRDDAEAQAVGAVLVDQVERVGRIAERLRHLAALRVADDAGEIDVPERNAPLERLAGPDELQARHDHARDPEEDDVRAGDERRWSDRNSRSPPASIAACVRPAQGGERPEPGRGPGVEDVLLLLPVFRVGRARRGKRAPWPDRAGRPR